jgi:hypothetical protein
MRTFSLLMWVSVYETAVEHMSDARLFEVGEQCRVVIRAIGTEEEMETEEVEIVGDGTLWLGSGLGHFRDEGKRAAHTRLGDTIDDISRIRRLVHSRPGLADAFLSGLGERQPTASS